MINVNRQYAHLSPKMRSVVADNLRRAGYDVAPLLPFSSDHPTPPLMVPTHPSVEGHDAPRSCVRAVRLGCGRTLVLSFNSDGALVERWEGPTALCTEERLDRMEANLVALSLPPLTLV